MELWWRPRVRVAGLWSRSRVRVAALWFKSRVRVAGGWTGCFGRVKSGKRYLKPSSCSVVRSGIDASGFRWSRVTGVPSPPLGPYGRPVPRAIW